MRLLATCLFLAPLFAQQPPDAPRPQRQRPAPKNLKLLPADENLIPTMRAFSSALGVQCEHCHVQGNFASDEKPQKETARKMIVMARQINTNFPDNNMRVTCYTCHRGAAEPLSAAPGGNAPSAAPPKATSPATTPPPTPPPAR